MYRDRARDKYMERAVKSYSSFVSISSLCERYKIQRSARLFYVSHVKIDLNSSNPQSMSSRRNRLDEMKMLCYKKIDIDDSDSDDNHERELR